MVAGEGELEEEDAAQSPPPSSPLEPVSLTCSVTGVGV
jgi:hypothetical protein